MNTGDEATMDRHKHATLLGREDDIERRRGFASTLFAAPRGFEPMPRCVLASLTLDVDSSTLGPGAGTADPEKRFPDACC